MISVPGNLLNRETVDIYRYLLRNSTVDMASDNGPADHMFHIKSSCVNLQVTNILQNPKDVEDP